MDKRCNDCRRSQQEGKRLALRCLETNTFVSPFATVCGKFQPRGKNTIGSGLIKQLKAKPEKEGSSEQEKGGSVSSSDVHNE